MLLVPELILLALMVYMEPIQTNETPNLDAVGTHAHPTGTNKTVALEVVASPTLAMGHSNTHVSGMRYGNRNECETSL
jgi:hypothetical protein